jgi:hypothetical protein
MRTILAAVFALWSASATAEEATSGQNSTPPAVLECKGGDCVPTPVLECPGPSSNCVAPAPVVECSPTAGCSAPTPVIECNGGNCVTPPPAKPRLR